MSVKRGEDWGQPGTVPPDVDWADSDVAAAQIISAARRASKPIPALALTGGDLVRTLGGRGDRLRNGDGTCVRVDLGAVLIDGRLHWFLAHLVARSSWMRGRVVIAANAAFIGSWNVAPKAHPGDGRFELLDGDLSFGDRWKARRRLASGTHLPHPDISVRRVEAVQIDLDRETTIRLDGAAIGAARSLSIRVEPDAVEIWV